MRAIAIWIDGVFVAALVAMLAIALALGGCRTMRPSVGGAPATPDRCAALDDRAMVWGGIGGAAGALGGASGLSTIVTDDRAVRTSLAVSAAVLGALAAGAAYVSRTATERYTEGGCGR